MKKFIREYAAYNVWANERICNVVDTLTEGMLNTEIPSSFSSIKKTLLHIWDAQLIWIRRIEGVSLKSFPSESFTGTQEDILEGVMSTSKRLEEIVNGFSKENLKFQKKYSTLKGGIVTSAQYQVLAHVINHSTYHRGQLITMFRIVGIAELPPTDLIFFYRERKK